MVPSVFTMQGGLEGKKTDMHLPWKSVNLEFLGVDKNVIKLKFELLPHSSILLSIMVRGVYLSYNVTLFTKANKKIIKIWKQFSGPDKPLF